LIMKDITLLYEKLDYTFKSPELLIEAFRHSSYVNELRDPGMRDNERLEFLGDAVLDLAISHILMEGFKEAKEGDLSKYRAAAVNEGSLCRVARELGIGDYLYLGRGEELTNGRNKPSILANTIEAILGALYLDTGYQETKRIIQRLFFPIIRQIEANEIKYDYKSLLQEFSQETYKLLPEYLLLEENGLAHDKTFKVALLLDGKTIAEGEGKSKKEAEQMAAREALDCLSLKKQDI
jgi:ribonuclease III